MNPRSVRYFVQLPPLSSEILERFLMSVLLTNQHKK
jgi:hypothetical protein